MSTLRAVLPEPMYATLGHALPSGADWTYEPKYDGMRVLAEVSSRGVRLVTRNGKEKRAQFPEVVEALRMLAAHARRTLVLDGEIVARRRAARRSAGSEFQPLQARMHLKDVEEISRLAIAAPATLVVFDLLRDGRTGLTTRTWRERRERLEALFSSAGGAGAPALILGETSARGATMLARARRAGWEGIVAKRIDARYQPGTRSDAWMKLKLQFRAEFVVGGFTEPRKTRPFLGALLLGAYDPGGRLAYVGHMGGGFDREGLRAMRSRLEKLERRTSPFAEALRTNEPAHWVAPKVVVEVKFAEWTADGKLRQPIFLGVRDDKAARDVTIEGVSMQRWSTGQISHDAA